jgi:thiamine-phosphate pyrophosphorylase
MHQISKLHFIATNAATAEKACQGGVDWIQLRLKNVSYEEYYTVAKEVKEVCSRFNAAFIINDNVELAISIGADGVHLGKEDMSPLEARKLLGPDRIIGSTANTEEDILRLSGQPISYIGLGPYRFTNTKQNLSPVLGIEGYHRIFSLLTEQSVYIPPVIAIGGIVEDDIASLLAARCYGVAVSGAIAQARDVKEAACILRNALSGAKEANCCL